MTASAPSHPCTARPAWVPAAATCRRHLLLLLLLLQVNASYELQFEGRTPIRQLGSVGLSVALRPCRINEELSAEGAFVVEVRR